MFRADPERERRGGASTPSLTLRVRLFLAVWLVAKIAFVQFVVPQRTAKRNPEPIAAELRGHVPAGQPLAPPSGEVPDDLARVVARIRALVDAAQAERSTVSATP